MNDTIVKEISDIKTPFICVNYATYTETIKYIENIRSLRFGNQAIIVVVDNSPTDSDFNQLNHYKKASSIPDDNLKIIRTQNRGYFQGLNEGILFARNLDENLGYYIVGNNDIVFKEDFIYNLIDYKLDQNTLVISPDIITTEGSHENPHVIRRIGFLRKLKYDVYYSSYSVARILQMVKSTERTFKEYDSEKKYIHMGIGALYILTPFFFKHFEKLREDVFLYGEEAILAGQINSVGGKILYDPEFVCYHNESATTSKLGSKSKYKIVQKSYRTYRKYL